MFDLQFTPEFFFAEGEPDDALGDTERPTSVWAAIHALDDDEWDEMARDVFGVPGHFLGPLTVLDSIRETNTCDTLTPPIRVYIDRNLDHWVTVYED